MPSQVSRRIRLLVWPLLVALCGVVFAFQLWQQNLPTAQGNGQHQLYGPSLPTYVSPTSTPIALERILWNAGIKTNQYTLGDLVDKLGPPEEVTLDRFGVEDARASVRFSYVKKGLSCRTAWDTLYSIERHRIAFCEVEYFDPAAWPKQGNWKGFDD